MCLSLFFGFLPRPSSLLSSWVPPSMITDYFVPTRYSVRGGHPPSLSPLLSSPLCPSGSCLLMSLPSFPSYLCSWFVSALCSGQPRLRFPLHPLPRARCLRIEPSKIINGDRVSVLCLPLGETPSPFSCQPLPRARGLRTVPSKIVHDDRVSVLCLSEPLGETLCACRHLAAAVSIKRVRSSVVVSP